MDLNKTYKEFFAASNVPLEYIDKTRADAPMSAVLFDFLASEGLNEEELEKVFNNQQLCSEIADMYIKMNIETARASYVMDLAFKSNSGVDFSADMNKAQENAQEYYENILSKLDEIRNNQR